MLEITGAIVLAFLIILLLPRLLGPVMLVIYGAIVAIPAIIVLMRFVNG